jgi:plasmid stabilization system protein ParE
MSPLIWSPAALRDIDRIYRFLAPKNVSAARRAVKSIQDGISAIRLQPGMGRMIDDMPDAFREWLIDFGDSGYVVRYRIDGSNLIALAVWHLKEERLKD